MRRCDSIFIRIQYPCFVSFLSEITATGTSVHTYIPGTSTSWTHTKPIFPTTDPLHSYKSSDYPTPFLQCPTSVCSEVNPLVHQEDEPHLPLKLVHPCLTTIHIHREFKVIMLLIIIIEVILIIIMLLQLLVS